MKRRSRDIQVFSMSFLDVLSCALGGTLILLLLVQQQDTTELEEPFVVVVITWRTANDDVDLHVTDPDGNHFFFEQRSIPGSRAGLEVDCLRGPGNEVWLHPAAVPGEYKIEYVFYSNSDPATSVLVTGGVVHGEGRVELPEIRMDTADKDQRVLVATVVVDSEGKVSVRP